MDSALAQRRQTLQAAIPVEVHKNDDDNNYVAELFAQLTNPDFFTSDSNDASDLGQSYQCSSEAGVSRPEKRGIKRSRQEVAQHDTSEESSQNHSGDGLNVVDAAPFDLDVLGFDMFDFNTLGQFDNFNPSFDFPGAVTASSVYAGATNLPVQNANTRLPEAPLLVNPVYSHLGNARAEIVNNPYVGNNHLSNTPGGRFAQQAPDDIAMMPLLVNPNSFSVMPGSSSAVIPSLRCPPPPPPPRPQQAQSQLQLQQQQQQPPTRPNAKRQRREPPPPPAPQNALQFVHDELSMPSDFRANPNNHARFKYHRDGTREYLNAPKKRRKRPCPVRDPRSSK